MGIDIEAVRARHAAATQGPWHWSGYRTSRQLDLVGKRADEVMGFRRWGMRGAQPIFAVDGLMYTAEDLTAGCDPFGGGRARITEVPHPDARFIAASWQDVADLLAEVDRLRAMLAGKGGPDMDAEQKRVAALEHFFDVLRPMVEAWGKRDPETLEDGEFEAVLALASVDFMAGKGAA